MNGSTPPHEDLAALLARECDAVGALVALLGEERRALRDDDAERLAALAGSKLVRADEIASIEERRRTLHAGAGDLPAAPAAIARLWNQLRESARVAARINRENGIMIQLRSEQIDRAVAFLSGIRGADSSTYDPSGLTRSAVAPRPLGIA